ncbi:tetratricopeptide repeat protein [Flavobacterium sp.]|jgi:tetratricopeptide (TPR) repeat protein|uniref:tetratricopeptide repeat protein n=1 Tax=Flavobacterium sp. TaxID=239 RepID=UPI0037BE64C5
MLKRILFFLLLSCLGSTLRSQNKSEIDSLLTVISRAKNDSIKISNYNKIAWHYVFNDTSQAKRYLQKSEKIALKNIKSYGYNEIMNLKGIMMEIKGETDSATFYFKKTLELSRKNRHKIIEVRSINNLGMLNYNQGNYKNALNYFLEGLKRNEILPDDKKIKNSIFYNNIGLIYQELNLNEKALYYHKKAYEDRKKTIS